MRLWTLGLLALGLAAVIVPARAHHSMAAMYDDKKPVTVKGTVSAYEWTNPHVFITVEASDGTWAVELPSRVELRRVGWTRDSVKAGDAVTVDASVARDGSKKAAAKSVTLANGKKLSAITTETIPVAKNGGPSRRRTGPAVTCAWVWFRAKEDTGPMQARRVWWRPPRR